MPPSNHQRHHPGPTGGLIRHWRSVRGWSQLELAHEASTSPRHLSFIETGRSRPNREILLRLAEALQMPLRERNRLLGAGGFATIYHDGDLSDPASADARRAIEFILRRQEPYSALALNTRWDILLENAAYRSSLRTIIPDRLVGGDGPANILRILFEPDGLLSHLVNRDAVAGAVSNRVRREAAFLGGESPALALLSSLLAKAGLQSFHAATAPDRPTTIIPYHLRLGDRDVRLFSTSTTLGAAQDIILEEVRIESFFPMDEIVDP